MKVQIWKYRVRMMDEFEIEMPGAAQIISVQMQGIQACLWAIVEPTFTPAMRKFRLVGTGHEFDLRTNDKFIGTFQDAGFVFHLFEIQ